MNGENIYSGIVKVMNMDKIDISNGAKDFIEQKIGILVTKEGIETLLYEINYDTYEDLIRNKIYKKEDILEDSLVKLNSITNIGNRISKKKALKVYYQSLKQVFNLSNIYIGDIAHIYKINKLEINGSVIYEPEYTIVKENRLIFKNKEKLIDLETYNEYYGKIDIGSFIIVNIRPFIEEDKNLEKGIILEKYRKMF